MIPTTIGDLEDSTQNFIPPQTYQITIGLSFFIVEKIKTSRRFLRKLDPKFDIDSSTFYELNKHTNPQEIHSFLDPCRRGQDVGLLSEAGCPSVADPGSNIVALAHKENIKVVPLVGPSSILLALMASGLNGQHFSFHGYLPIEKNEKLKKIKFLEKNCKNGSAQIFMETPFRNESLFSELVLNCNDNTMLCVACNISTNEEFIKTLSIFEWRKNKPSLNKKPTIFIMGFN